MGKIKNKKGQVIESVLIIATLILAGQAVYATIAYQTTVAKSVNSLDKVTEFFSILDKNDLFNKESARLAISQAFADTLKKPALKGKCNSIVFEGRTIAVLNENCTLDDAKIKEDFLFFVAKGFENVSGNKKFSITLDGGNVSFIPSDVKSSVFVVGDFIRYNVTHQFDSPLAYPAPNLDLEKLGSQLLSKKASCQSDKQKLSDCMASLKVMGWETQVIGAGHLIVTLKSEANYFYDGGFKPVELRFAIEKLS